MTGLVLAGTQESRELARLLADDGITAVASLAGATREPKKLDLPTRIGGFGGVEGMKEFIKNNGIEWVVDTTHPFASQISTNCFHACKEMNTRCALLERLPWNAQTGDDWTEVAVASQAVMQIAEQDVVFLGTGRNTVKDFGDLRAQKTYCRVIDRPQSDYPHERGEYLVGRPPFSVGQEIALFERLGITKIIVKNAGGRGGFAKLEAARELNIPVILLQRPEVPFTTKLSSVKEAFEWVKAQL